MMTQAADDLWTKGSWYPPLLGEGQQWGRGRGRGSGFPHSGPPSPEGTETEGSFRRHHRRRRDSWPGTRTVPRTSLSRRALGSRTAGNQNAKTRPPETEVTTRRRKRGRGTHWKSTEGEGEKLLDTGETPKVVARLLRWTAQGRRDDDSQDGRGVATRTALEPALATVLETVADLHKAEEEEGRRRKSRRTLADDQPA